MKKTFLIVAALIAIFVACQAIPYKSDLGVLPPVLANSPEFLVYVNGKTCRDSGGEIGFCSFRVTNDQSVVISSIEQQFAYNVDFQVSANLPASLNKTYVVPAGKAFSITIKPTDYAGESVFNFTFDIAPIDAATNVGSFATGRVIITDSKYIPMQKPIRSGKYLYLGESAHYSTIWEPKGKYLKDETALETPATAAIVMGESGRFAYWWGASQ